MFDNRSLTLQCRRRVYVAMVPSTGLYGAETWTTKAPDLRHLNLFHHQFIRTVVGVLRQQKWETRVTSSALAKTPGVPEDIGLIVRERAFALAWTRSTDGASLVVEVCSLRKSRLRPAHGPRKRWRDVVVDDFASVEPPVPACGWYDAAQNRPEWRTIDRRPPKAPVCC